MNAVRHAKEVLKMDRELTEAKDKLNKIEKTIALAEEWTQNQEMEESVICMGALKDIRRIVRSK